MTLIPGRGGAHWARALGPLVLADLRHRYGGSSLSALWALAAPLVEVATYAILFGVILRPQVPTRGLGFALYVAAGLLPWASLREGLESSAAVLGDNRWMRRASVPLQLLVARQVLAALPRAVFGLVLVLLLSWWSGASPGPAWLVPLLALYLQTAAAYGLGLALAPLGVLHTSLRPLLTSALTALTFASPIVYPESVLAGPVRAVVEWNPFTSYLRLYRFALAEPGGSPSVRDLAVALAFPLLCLALGSVARERLWWPARDRL
jgi:ABC-type polysaccharide/polyol phosphate export permease